MYKILNYFLSLWVYPYLGRFGGAIGGALGAVASIGGAASSLFGGGSSGGGGGGGVSVPSKDAVLKELEAKLGLLGVDVLESLKTEDFTKSLQDIPFEDLTITPEQIQSTVDELSAQPAFEQFLAAPDAATQLGATDLETLSTEKLQELISSGGITPERLELEQQIRGDVGREREEEFGRLLAQVQATGQKTGTTTGQLQQNVLEATGEQGRRVAEQERLYNLGKLEQQQQAVNQALALSAQQQQFTGAREEANLARQLQLAQEQQLKPIRLAALAQELQQSNIGQQTAETLARQERPFRLLGAVTGITGQQQQSYLGTLAPSLAAQQANMAAPTGGLLAGYGSPIQGLGGQAGGGLGSLISSIGGLF